MAFATPARGDAPAPAATNTTPPPDAPPPDPTAAESLAEWEGRDRLLAEQSTIGGGIGLLHTQHATSGAPGQFRLAFATDFFQAGFLCTSQYPCQNPTGGKPLTSDSMGHIGGTLTLTATVTPWLEVYAATAASGDSDSANHPALLQVLGDTELGLKAFRSINRVFSLGSVVELDLVNGAGSVGLAGGGTGARLRLLGTSDLRGLDKPIPLRVSLNLTYSLDNTAQVVQGIESAANTQITRIERYGLELNRVDHFDMALGAETFLVSEKIRPFIEYTLLAPINRQGYVCHPNNPSADQCLQNDAVAPSKLTLGSRFFPWNRSFSVLLAMDIGVTGTGNFIEELSPVAPWDIFIGAGWAIDTRDRPVAEKTRTVERTIGPKPQAHIRGIVHAKADGGAAPQGIGDAIVVFDGRPEMTSLATANDGHFRTPGVDPGSYKFLIHAKGYRDGTCSGEVGTSLDDVTIDCPVELALVHVEKNEITITQQIQFQVDSANILPESDALMTEIAETLVKNPRIKRVEVQGHTDSSGTSEYNQKLSEQRATAVCAWLEAHGVPQGKLVPRGYGEDRPLIPNVTKALKAQNRRVQFIILEQTAEAP